HNGFSHQDPGFLDLVANKSPEVVRIYLPPDGNCLLSVMDHCLRSVNYVNVIVSDKQDHLQYLDMDEAIAHCTKGASIWPKFSTDAGQNPDVVMASCGDISTHETLAAIDLLLQHFPDLKIILAHPSFPWQEEALSVATHKPNVYIDLSGWSPKYFPPILVRYINSILQDKMLFGSDWPVWNSAIAPPSLMAS
ncbi:MAG: amidohydrolase family protein, partial [Bradyrhizobium sp.]|nr:amidohydrolase family protein [Bradyrhizobium sp.]